MYISSFKTDGFKNLKNISLNFDKRLNILCGENAQGKTNLLEAVWLCSGLRSFRGTKDKDYVSFDSDIATIELDFCDTQRQQKINIGIQKQNPKDKNVLLNGVKLKSLSKLFGTLSCVIFTPEDLELSKGSPEIRRRFLDLSVSMIKKSYLGVINKYAAVIEQRNKLLKNIGLGLSSKEELLIWDEQLAKLGSYISVLRYAYVVKLWRVADKLYKEISGNKESLSLGYSSTIFDNINENADYSGEMSEIYFKALRDSENEDIKMGFTSKGVHRDDLLTYINGLSSREFGSQGQNRSVALILKLAQAYILKDELKDAPVILLDDVLSELDKSRQEFILSKIDDCQVFITCCELIGRLKDKNQGSRFLIKDGEAKKI